MPDLKNLFLVFQSQEVLHSLIYSPLEKQANSDIAIVKYLLVNIQRL